MITQKIFLLLSLLLVLQTLAAEPGMRISTVANNGMPKDIAPRKAAWNFGPGSLWTHKGWQYATYWDENSQVSVARRKLPSGEWSVASLPGYQRTETGDRGKGGAISRGFGDGHEKVALGISPDGFIHLSFDQHLSTLRYRTSKLPVADNPESVSWSADLFGPVRDNLGGPQITSVTYPSFHTDGSHFLLYLRLGGGSGSANSHLFTYEDGTWTEKSEKKSQIIDRKWSGGNGTVNAYPFGLAIHDGRCHLTWCWRDTPVSNTCHDLCYAYSDDYGDTWKNNDGKVIGDRGRKFITADSPGLSVWPIPAGKRYINGGSMTIDATGRVLVLVRGEDGKPSLFQRDPDTARWSRSPAKALGKLISSDRNQIHVVADGSLYRFESSDSGDWKEINSAPFHLFRDSKAGRDVYRLSHDGWTSIIGQQGKKVSVVDFRVTSGK